MSGKNLSTSTLSLRFMQNAQRAKFMKEVELEKAEVQDDAQWEVGREVREAWGLVSGQEASQSVTHEGSYLPFLFSESSESTDITLDRPKGRRTFTKEGEEKPTEKGEPEEPTDASPGQKEVKRSRVHPHPIPIKSVSGKLLHGLQPLKTLKPSKSAREAIFDNRGVGADIRAISPAKPKSTTTATAAATGGKDSTRGFLKPSGVDAPTHARSDIIDGAREKRLHEVIDQEQDESKNKKRKKRKQAT
ncbi:hypothetical protein AX17_006887 [Amanita inopinata Kibby_2008]|nr:hypothetical protein AX17_006887 [Amanita inopinata Kibby_2008]